jgi:hypothetical protein
MPGMKITLDAAMRVRDVSRPQPRHAAAALEADAQAAAAQAGSARPAGTQAGRGTRPRDRASGQSPGISAPGISAPGISAAGISAPGTPAAGIPAPAAPAARGTGGKRHRSRKRFPR